MSDDTHLDRTDETSIGRVIRLDGNADELEMTMKHDFGWVCDELARLHADLEVIRARRRVEQAAAQAAASPPGDNPQNTRPRLRPVMPKAIDRHRPV